MIICKSLNNKCIFCANYLITKIRPKNTSSHCSKCKAFYYLINSKNIQIYWSASYKNYNIVSSAFEKPTTTIDYISDDLLIDHSISSINSYFNIPKSKDELDNIINSILLYN